MHQFRPRTHTGRDVVCCVSCGFSLLCSWVVSGASEGERDCMAACSSLFYLSVCLSVCTKVFLALVTLLYLHLHRSSGLTWRSQFYWTLIRGRFSHFAGKALVDEWVSAEQLLCGQLSHHVLDIDRPPSSLKAFNLKTSNSYTEQEHSRALYLLLCVFWGSVYHSLQSPVVRNVRLKFKTRLG